MLNDNDILGRPRTTKYWLVLPKDYRPGDGYHTFRYMKDAANKAMAMGIGTELRECTTHLRKCRGYTIRVSSPWVYEGRTKR